MRIRPDGTLGPAIAIDTSDGFYTYEFSIPLQESEVRFFGLGASSNSDIAINVKWGEIDREEMRERVGATLGGEVGGRTPIGGGRPDGGMRGGPPRGMDKRPQLKKVDIWFTTQLVSH